MCVSPLCPFFWCSETCHQENRLEKEPGGRAGRREGGSYTRPRKLNKCIWQERMQRCQKIEKEEGTFESQDTHSKKRFLFTLSYILLDARTCDISVIQCAKILHFPSSTRSYIIFGTQTSKTIEETQIERGLGVPHSRSFLGDNLCSKL